jgi:hypothetical protein
MFASPLDAGDPNGSRRHWGMSKFAVRTAGHRDDPLFRPSRESSPLFQDWNPWVDADATPKFLISSAGHSGNSLLQVTPAGHSDDVISATEVPEK